MNEKPSVKDIFRIVVYPATLYYWLQRFLDSEIFVGRKGAKGKGPVVEGKMELTDEVKPDRR